MEGQRHWYVIHTYSGYENKVKLNLESKVHSLGMEDMIFQVLVPMQDELETKDDQQKVVSRKVFPGYVLIEMIVDDRTWYAVRNTPGVTGFVGTGTKPIPFFPTRSSAYYRETVHWEEGSFRGSSDSHEMPR